MTPDEVMQAVRDMDAIGQVNVWLTRGDGVAVYENRDMSHPGLGRRQLVSYGGPDAQIEENEPPERLPDIGYSINWRYLLVGSYRGVPFPAEEVVR